MRKQKILKIIGLLLGCIIAAMLIINIIPPQKNVENNPFIVGKGNLPLVAAHRGGKINNPENTILAFREAVHNIGVDILESDLYLTKDGYLVLNHDSYIDETCNVNGDISEEDMLALIEDKSKRHYIEDMTLEELKQYNFGYYFTDKEGNRPYKDTENLEEIGLQITTVDQLFAEFYESNPDLMFIVEIKNRDDRGKKACSVLDEILQKYPEYQNQIVVGTFRDEVEQELMEKYPYILRGAPTGSAKKFILTQLAGVNIFDDGSFACLQIPTSYDLGIEFKLDLQNIVDRAHRRNIAVQYWTINDADEMRTLIELGADAIMTDDPVLLNCILEEYK